MIPQHRRRMRAKRAARWARAVSAGNIAAQRWNLNTIFEKPGERCDLAPGGEVAESSASGPATRATSCGAHLGFCLQCNRQVDPAEGRARRTEPKPGEQRILFVERRRQRMGLFSAGSTLISNEHSAVSAQPLRSRAQTPYPPYSACASSVAALLVWLLVAHRAAPRRLKPDC
jgi:hypothetical protein